ncbi:hypothetical protein [Paraburkholderia sp. IW21]|uniref:hypothetical protein n=1 Tax=Paraburkholderia sp. IW21 TaxID=3242488 RepID=UPI003522C4EE
MKTNGRKESIAASHGFDIVEFDNCDEDQYPAGGAVGPIFIGKSRLLDQATARLVFAMPAMAPRGMPVLSVIWRPENSATVRFSATALSMVTLR